MDRSTGTAVRRVTGALLWARYLLLAAGCAIPVIRALGSLPQDWLLFETAARITLWGRGRYQLDGGALDIYAEMPRIQFGPPAILATMPLQYLPIRWSLIAAEGLMMACGLTCVWVVERLAALAGVPYRRRALATVLGGVPFLYAWSLLAVDWMHIEDVIALTCAAFALLALRRDRWWAMAALLGVAAAAKPWAVVLWPLVFALPRPRRAPAALVALIAAVAWWLPYVVANPGTVAAIGSIPVPVHQDAAVRLLGVASGGLLPSPVRFLQFGLAAAAAFVAVRRGLWYVAPAAALIVRVVTDSQTWPYYAAEPILGALLVDAVRGRRIPWLTAVVAAVELGLPHLGVPLLTAAARACLLLVPLALLAAGTARRGRASVPGPAEPAVGAPADAAAEAVPTPVAVLQ